MLLKLRDRIQNEEKGFTLIELLVVMLIIGILAAIALPVFLGQQEKGEDASAKSNARNLVSQIRSCHAETRSYLDCDTTDEVTPTGLPMVNGAPTANDTVGVSASAANTYTVIARSSGTPARLFRIVNDGTADVRTCDTNGNGTYSEGTDDGGGCNNGTW